ncbi:MAG: hypothetical protein KIS95_00170 [Anaerolineae bacterium]|uniref:choice-of-anchor P family protein n=1 Tax=Promineifilum sp. TaxID=2664178 RepID=UPI001D3B0FE3|nr:hypothetical protein [Anaerolineales bacterium]MCB8934201.1 hypothetical protein [Promineifilum sp.]MCO5179822.1 hypothetical protein [Promineifilum sp.]MCW5845618.1 hypothetical protein [Anaerolineae bacterium]
MKSRLLVFVLLVFGLLIAGVQTTAAAQQTTYSGRGIVVGATVLGIPVTLVDTGPLPASGGAIEASLADLSLPGVLTAGIAQATSVGQNNYTRTDSGLADVGLTVAGLDIGADLLLAQAEALCPKATKASLKGSSVVVNLTLNGQPIAVTGKPNQTVQLPLGLGHIIINEQTETKNGNDASITVNALHVVVTGIADVVIGHAEAGITCARQNQCSTKSFASGMGKIKSPSGTTATFAFTGGTRNGNELYGNLKYDDKNGTKVVGTAVTDYQVTGAKSRRIEGTAKINGSGSYTYTIDVTDGGAAKKDTFRLRLSNGYDTGVQHLTGSGRMTCGNIRVNKPCK